MEVSISSSDLEAQVLILEFIFMIHDFFIYFLNREWEL